MPPLVLSLNTQISVERRTRKLDTTQYAVRRKKRAKLTNSEPPIRNAYALPRNPCSVINCFLSPRITRLEFREKSFRGMGLQN